MPIAGCPVRDCCPHNSRAVCGADCRTTPRDWVEDHHRVDVGRPPSPRSANAVPRGGNGSGPRRRNLLSLSAARIRGSIPIRQYPKLRLSYHASTFESSQATMQSRIHTNLIPALDEYRRNRPNDPFGSVVPSDPSIKAARLPGSRNPGNDTSRVRIPISPWFRLHFDRHLRPTASLM